jgi:hypothetical protein
MAVGARTQTIYFFELWRAVASGILETAASTFLLTIAVKHLQAGAFAKGMLAGSGSVGLLLSPVAVTLVTRKRWPPSQAASYVLAIGAAAFLCASLLPGITGFVVCSVVALASSSAIIPLLTHMYQENYPEYDRGRRFSRTLMIRIATAALFAKLAGDALTGHLDQYRWLILVFALALGFASFCLARCPTEPIVADGGEHPLRALRFVREDKLFRRTLICWMLMGFANLMMLPLRVEYLANSKYGLHLSVGMIAVLTGVIPNAARFVLSPIWGHLFDRMNFFALRVTLNIGFAVGILSFFASDSVRGLIFGAVVFGISNAGGDVAWSLWVTKFAPPGRVADYMAAHTFLTGLRGAIAPLVAFSVVNQITPALLATIAAGLIVLASSLLLPEIKFGKRALRAMALVEEVSE